MKVRYVCGDEQLHAEIDYLTNSLNIIYSNPANYTLQMGNRELFKAIGYVLDLAFKRNDIDRPSSIADEINATIYNLIFSGSANTFNIPIRVDGSSLEFEAAYNRFEDLHYA